MVLANCVGCGQNEAVGDHVTISLSVITAILNAVTAVALKMTG
jgi:hypothetical protein